MQFIVKSFNRFKMKFVRYLVVAIIVLQCVLSNPVPYYKPLTLEEAERLASWTPASKTPMWQLSGQYEGDMIIHPGIKNGVIDTNLRWPNREIPYEFSNDFTAQERQFIANSLAMEYARTCIRIRPRKSTDYDYVYITGNNTGCWSMVGRSGGRQELNLQRNGCLWYGTIAHEFLHAAGFYHQQSAPERDDWVYIYWQNIQPGQEHNFEKYPLSMVNSFGQRYDYRSIMHYDKNAFSANGQPTILPKDPNVSIGQSQRLSPIDIIKLNKMYNCI
ncbi:hypothetical protein ILUMI_21347 [Ignelater luminosus]|uniref:Metalloendopeptidase n=1 Tax=Ignelater luminosus TaxID=2038154 RepID=A0A8K0CCK9_IGNLU|nr:hypothetical protein ILUMI_21347 [Ignelater luminosus]